MPIPRRDCSASRAGSRLARWRAVCAALACAAGLSVWAGLPPTRAVNWKLQLQSDLDAIAVPPGTSLGVYVHDLASGVAVGRQAEERWYLASTVKLPVAIAVLRGIEAGHFTLDTTLRLRADDRVDGAGHTNAQPIAAALTIRFLLEQMMSYSDNTASDMLIELVGLDAVNAVVRTLVPEGIGRITTLAEVRRQVYGQLTPKASQLGGGDLLRLHALPNDAARLQLLSQLLDVPATAFKRPTLASAYAAYYREGLNSGRLDAYGALLASVAQGRALGPEQTRWLLSLMERTRTGSQRIKAGLPAESRFAHKTGTQRQRTCDAGIVRTVGMAPAAGTVVVACVRGESSLAKAEAALREVGLAVCRSGLLARETKHASTCHVSPPAIGLGADPSTAAAPAVVREPGERE